MQENTGYHLSFQSLGAILTGPSVASGGPELHVRQHFPSREAASAAEPEERRLILEEFEGIVLADYRRIWPCVAPCRLERF